MTSFGNVSDWIAYENFTEQTYTAEVIGKSKSEGRRAMNLLLYFWLKIYTALCRLCEVTMWKALLANNYNATPICLLLNNFKLFFVV